MPRTEKRLPKSPHTDSKLKTSQKGCPSIRPGLLVESNQPFNTGDVQLLWIFGQKLGGNEQIREITVSHDRTHAAVEFYQLDVLEQLLPMCGDLCDPVSKQPLNLIVVDLATFSLKVTGYPPSVVDKYILKGHFEGEANGQQVDSVKMSKDFATITFVCPTVALSFSKTTELFGTNLHLKFNYSCLDIGLASQKVGSVYTSLHVQGIPQNMLHDKSRLSKALKWYFKETTGYEVSKCVIDHGVGLLTFTDSSAVRAILISPPTKKFLAGNSLQISATNVDQVSSPAASRRKLRSHALAPTVTTGVIFPAPVNDQSRPFTHQRLVSNRSDPNWTYPQPSYQNGIHDSQSTSIPSHNEQQAPFPGPPHISGQQRPDSRLGLNEASHVSMGSNVLHPQRTLLTKAKYDYLKKTLPKLNGELASLNAHAIIEESELECRVLVISPLKGSTSINGWTDIIIANRMKHFNGLCEKTISFPSKEAKSDIQDLLYNHPTIDLVEEYEQSVIIIGCQEVIAEVCKLIKEICLKYVITTVNLKHFKKHLKFLQKFHLNAFLKLVDGQTICDIQFYPDAGTISIKANQVGLEKAKREITRFLSAAKENIINISSFSYALLSSRRGAEKLSEILGDFDPQIAYDFEQTFDSMQYRICFLSENNEVLQKVKTIVLAYAVMQRLETTVAKIGVCGSMVWRKLIDKLCEKNFVSVSADRISQTIIVTGEKLACRNTTQEIDQFLAKHTNVDERISITNSEWFVITQNFSDKLNAISDRARERSVHVKWDEYNCQDSQLSILISGEPEFVNYIKSLISALSLSVYKKELPFVDVPFAKTVLASIKDNLQFIETVDKVKVDITVENITPNQVVPLSSNFKFISLVNGDLLEQQVDVYVNFTNSDLNLSNGLISHRLLSMCGEELQKEASKYAPLQWGKVAVTNSKNLKCKKIFHINLPAYKVAISEQMFQKTVREILHVTKHNNCSSIAIPSLDVVNLGYPENVSARILFDEVFSFHSQYPNSAQKFLFVTQQKSVFQIFSKEFATQLARQTKALPPPIQAQAAGAGAGIPVRVGSTILSIIQGNIAEESSDIIVNTTTENMILKDSAVSKAILEKAGNELQELCQQNVMNGKLLSNGQILATPAFGNLCCMQVIHAHLPPKGSVAASSTHPCQLLIEKIVRDCLTKAEREELGSISFPAFGLGKGGYTVEEIAKPMLTVFRMFGESYPKSLRFIRVVIFDQDLYEKFNKFYNQFFGRSTSNPTPPLSLSQHTIIGSSRKINVAHHKLETSRTAGQTLHSSALHSKSTVIFTIFAASSKKCEETASKLHHLFQDKIITRKISNPIIGQLLKEDELDIFQIGVRMGVQVNITKTSITEICIYGEKSKVIEAERDIEKLLICIQQTITSLETIKWKSQEEDGTYELFPPEASMRLEYAFIKKLKTIELAVDGINLEVDLVNFIEINKSTKKKRKIKRSKESVQDYPPTWITPGNRKLKGVVKVCEVPKGTQEHSNAIKEFEESLIKSSMKFSIQRVARIENMTEYNKHMALQNAIRDKHKKDPLVKRLFHGSELHSLKSIFTHGFNRNFAADVNAAYYGKGVYFAVEATFSAQEKYADPGSTGLQYMLVCRVIVGKYTKGTQDMKVAPSLMRDSRVLYDSLVDNVTAPTIFVAMTDAQAYPEYLITFKKL